MTRLQEVRQTIYARFAAVWVNPDTTAFTPFVFANEAYTPSDQAWGRFWVQPMPGGQETIGAPGNRKYERVGNIILALREAPGAGTDLGDTALGMMQDAFEGCRMEPHDIRFTDVIDKEDVGEIEGGRWWATTISGRFVFEDIR